MHGAIFEREPAVSLAFPGFDQARRFPPIAVDDVIDAGRGLAGRTTRLCERGGFEGYGAAGRHVHFQKDLVERVASWNRIKKEVAVIALKAKLRNGSC